MRYTPRTLKWGMRLWPPYLGSGIFVRDIASDWSRVDVELRVNRLNYNLHRTAFGGAMQSMSDPFYTIMLIHRLGRGYRVWDRAAEIDFLKPGRRRVYGRFEVTDDDVRLIREATADGSKFLTWFDTRLFDRDGQTVARVRRQLYIRRLLR